MNNPTQSDMKKNEHESSNKKEENISILNKEKNDSIIIMEDKYASPIIVINKKRNRFLSSSSSNQSETQDIIKENEKKTLSTQSYNSKLRERDQVKGIIQKDLEKPSSNCHHCREIVLLNKMLICCSQSCHESYCFNCIRTYYNSYVDKAPLSSLKRNSNNNKWICFKCNMNCLCLKCISLPRKKVVTQSGMYDAYGLSSGNSNNNSSNNNKINKQFTTFKTELVNKEHEKETPNSNQFNCQILKLKDEALIQSLNNYTIPKINTHSNNNIVISKDKPHRRKKKKKNKVDKESHSPKSSSIEEMKIYDAKIQQLVKQCEGYFYEQSKRKSFFKKTCLFCIGQCFNTNELLYFRYLKDFLQYVNYLFSYQPLIIYNKEIANENKEILFEDLRELNGAKNKDDWHFSQPKVVCKGCLMTILNKPDCNEILRKQLMDKKDKKKDSSDKEKELEQENEIKLQTKDISEQIARDMQFHQMQKQQQQQQVQQLNKKKEEEKISNGNVFNEVFNNPQELSQSSNLNKPSIGDININNQEIEHQNQTNKIKIDNIYDNSSSNYLNSQIPVFIPELFPQYFQNNLNEITLYFNQLINDTHAINQQYQNSLITMETITSYYLILERKVKRNYAKEQEILDIMFNCKSLLFSFMNYLDYLCSINQSNDSRSQYNLLCQLKDKLEYEFRTYNELMIQMLKSCEILRRISIDYLDDMKMEYSLLENINAINNHISLNKYHVLK